MEQLSEKELLSIDGGKNWFYIVGGGVLTIAGAASTVVCPNPGSVDAIIGGIVAINDGWND